jgi:hypothetical protein
MALLMKWLHPDLISGGASAPCLDRSVYAKRVTKAWDGVKTGARRRASNDSSTQERRGQNISKHPVIGILLRIDELQDEASPDGEAPEPAHNFGRPEISQQRPRKPRWKLRGRE